MTPVVWNGQDGVTWNYGRGSGSSQSGVSARADAATQQDFDSQGSVSNIVAWQVHKWLLLGIP